MFRQLLFTFGLLVFASLAISAEEIEETENKQIGRYQLCSHTKDTWLRDGLYLIDTATGVVWKMDDWERKWCLFALPPKQD